MTKIYNLRIDRSQYQYDDYDGSYRGDMGAAPDALLELNAMNELPWKSLPEILEFDTTNPARLETVHIAHVDSIMDVFSNQLIEALKSVGSLDWTLVPARFFDQATKEEVCKGKFSGVFFEYHNDFFDYESSDFTTPKFYDEDTDRMRKKVSVIKKMVLREPNGGFPPFFRLLADPKIPLVSEVAHDAIVKAGLEGLDMTLAGEY